jgi:broad specificity phosphatase PhoE
MEAIVLFRHGQTDFNKDRRFQGTLDIPLNQNGLVQAEKTAAVISNLIRIFFNPKVIRLECYTSDLQRASRTASYVTQSLEMEFQLNTPFTPVAFLREWNCGDFQGNTIEEYKHNNAETLELFFRNFENDPDTTPYPGGECKNDVRERLQTLITQLRQPSRWKKRSQFPTQKDYTKGITNVGILSSHGGLITVLLSLICEAKSYENNIIGNGDVLLLIPQAEKPQMWEILRHYKVGSRVAAKARGRF